MEVFFMLTASIFRIGRILCATALLATAGWGCDLEVEEDDSGAASIGVVTQGLSAADVAKVTVTVTGPNIANPIVHNLVV
jgi:hypothetical protein